MNYKIIIIKRVKYQCRDSKEIIKKTENSETDLRIWNFDIRQEGYCRLVKRKERVGSSNNLGIIGYPYENQLLLTSRHTQKSLLCLLNAQVERATTINNLEENTEDYMSSGEEIIFSN